MLHKLDIFLTNRKLLLLLILVNLAGFFFGLYYYQPQLAATDSIYWLFVIDSPLYVLLFAFIAFLLYDKRNMPNWLPFITSIGLIKVGFWTVLVLILHFDFFYGIDPLVTSLNIPLHIVMVLGGLVLARRVRVSKSVVSLALGWFLFNDFLDYSLGHHTFVPNDYIILLGYESIIASVFVTLLIYFKWGKKNPFEE